MAVKCETCGESFKNEQGLGGHKRLRHGVPGDQQYIPSIRVLGAIEDIERKLIDMGSFSMLWDRVASLGERIKQLEHDLEEEKKKHEEDIEELRQANASSHKESMQFSFESVEKLRTHTFERIGELEEDIGRRLDRLKAEMGATKGPEQRL